MTDKGPTPICFCGMSGVSYSGSNLSATEIDVGGVSIGKMSAKQMVFLPSPGSEIKVGSLTQDGKTENNLKIQSNKFTPITARDTLTTLIEDLNFGYGYVFLDYLEEDLSKEEKVLIANEYQPLIEKLTPPNEVEMDKALFLEKWSWFYNRHTK